MSVRLNGPKAGEKEFTFNLKVSDTGEAYLVTVTNAVLHHEPGKTAGSPDADIEIARLALAQLALGEKTVEEVMADGARITGRPEALTELLGLLDVFDFWFNIVEP